MGYKREEVLRTFDIDENMPSRATIKRHYLKLREEQGLSERCDIEGCSLYDPSVKWNGKAITLILDHVNGSKSQNKPKNLRLVCPNCASQLHTHAGGNKDRVKLGKGKIEIRTEEDNIDRTVISKVTNYSLTGFDVNLKHKKKSKK